MTDTAEALEDFMKPGANKLVFYSALQFTLWCKALAYDEKEKKSQYWETFWKARVSEL